MQKNDAARRAVLALISERYSSDADFERAAELPPKTVSNWRRERSSSYMRMLPSLAALFGVRASDLIGADEEGDAAEARLVRLWRETEALESGKRRALADALESVIRLYLEGEEKRP